MSTSKSVRSGDVVRLPVQAELGFRKDGSGVRALEELMLSRLIGSAKE